MKKSLAVIVIAGALSLSASAGILKFSGRHIGKPVLHGAEKVGKVAIFPVRHPKKSVHGIEKAGKAAKKVIV